MSPSLYEYEPLGSAKSIRIVELLPGAPGEDIQILLHHRLLSDLPRCSAMSYMWGDASRILDISCENAIIKVTASALLLLQKLRTPTQSQLIWIDGICINQDDLDESSQQVTLMRDIYQLAGTVLIWIGDETKYTQQAFEIAKDLARGYDYIRSNHTIVDNGFRQFKTTSDIPALLHLEHYTKEPSWAGVRDAFLSRPYFRRLWIVQEIVLATNPIVVCGTHRISWETFYKASRCIWYCQFLRSIGLKTVGDADILGIGRMREPDAIPLLPVIFASFSSKEVSNPRDRVYGVLGLLSEGSDHELLKVDYTKPVERVFRDATAYVILQNQTLAHWSRLHFDPTIRSKKHAMPSWAEGFDENGGRFVEKYEPLLANALRLGDRKMTIEGDTLTIFGIILDTIEVALPNFSTENFKTIVLDVFGFCFSTHGKVGAEDNDADMMMKAAQRTHQFINPYDIDRFRDEPAIFQILSRWILSDLGINTSVVEQNPKVEDLAEKHPKLKDAYPDQIASEKTIQDVVAEDTALQWMLEQTQSGSGSEYETGLRWEVLATDLDVGRNCFRSKLGYFGLGPAGKAGAEGTQAAVQVGDILVLVLGAPKPVILRPRDGDGDGDTYIVVGSCHVGNLLEVPSPVLRTDKPPEPVRLKIR